MELHFMFVLLWGAVGRILSLSPPMLSPTLTPVPSCKRGGSEQFLTCSASPGLPWEQVFPSSVSPHSGWMLSPRPGGAGMRPGLVLYGAGSADPLAHLCPVMVLPLGMWHLQPLASLDVRMGDSQGDGNGACWAQQPGTQHLLPDRPGDTPCPLLQTVPVHWRQQTQEGEFLLRAPAGRWWSGWGTPMLLTLPHPCRDAPTPTGSGSLSLG